MHLHWETWADSSWTMCQSGCSRTARTWGWNSHSTSRWRYTRVSGTPTIGPRGAGLRRRTGPRPHSSHPTGASTWTAVNRRWRPSFVQPKARGGGTRRSSKIWTAFSTGGSAGSAKNTPSTTTALIVLDTLKCLRSASVTVTSKCKRVTGWIQRVFLYAILVDQKIILHTPFRHS